METIKIKQPKYKPKMIEDCTFHLTEQCSFDELIIWANALEVEVNYPPTGDMWPDWEIELRQEVNDALLNIISPTEEG